MRAWRTAAVVAGVAAVLAGSVAAASANPATVSPMGIGYANSVWTYVGIWSAASSTTYYVGGARPGDNIADICWIEGSDNRRWDLVLERTGAAGDHFGNTVGYIPEEGLSDGGAQQRTQCPTPDALQHQDAIVYNDTTMRSAASTGAYPVGTAVPSDQLTVYCWIKDGNGVAWYLTVQQAGRGGDHLPYAASMLPADSVAAEYVNPCGQS